MTDKPKFADLMDLPWDKLRVELCAEIRTALGEEREHEPQTKIEAGWGIVDLGYCKHCGCSTESGDASALSPCIHPITEPPEVVAERLREKARERRMGIVSIADRAKTVMRIELGTSNDAVVWFVLQATPTQRIIVCLLALGEIEE